jgi:hypothetical protein
MNLYIKIENGVTKGNPALEENLIEAFGSIPENWEPFVRIERPIPTVYQILEADEPVYAKVDGVWTDVWPLREMTAEEKAATQQATITAFNSRQHASNWSAWTLDEATCTMQPPIPRLEPVEGKTIAWCGAENNWKETPPRPEGNYKFDFPNWQWVPVDQG